MYDRSLIASGKPQDHSIPKFQPDSKSFITVLPNDVPFVFELLWKGGEKVKKLL